MPSYVVSACLAGIACRYDGNNNLCEPVVKLVKEGRALALCPEVLGGLTIPRIPCEIQGDLVLDAKGNDCTSQFIKGAEKALKLSLEAGCYKAILKSRSPSCGRDVIYDGTFSRNLVQGQGIFAKLLQENGFEILTEEDFNKLEL